MVRGGAARGNSKRGGRGAHSGRLIVRSNVVTTSVESNRVEDNERIIAPTSSPVHTAGSLEHAPDDDLELQPPSDTSRPRGINHGTEPPSNEDDRALIEIYEGRFIPVSVSRAITTIMRAQDFQETKFQRKVNTLEVYEHVHKHREKDGTQKDFCDNKSKRVKNVYTTKVSAKYGSDVSSQTSFDSDAWIEVVGGATKGRTYGLETFVDPKSSRSSFSASSRFEEGASSQVIDDEQLKIIEERIREDVRKGFEVEMEERMKTQLEKLLAEYLDHGASSSGLRDGVVSQHGASSSGHA